MKILAPIGRVLYALIFLSSGIFGHFVNHSQTTAYAESTGLPMASALVYLSGIMIVVGGLSIMLGYYARIGAVLCTLFLITAAFAIHDFWTVDDPQMRAMQMVQFMKNVSMSGAGFLIMYFGSGPYSLKDWSPASLQFPTGVHTTALPSGT